MAISRIYYWHKMYREVEKYIRECTNCHQGKSYYRFQTPLKLLPTRSGFGSCLHIDFVGPLLETFEGFKHIFRVVDSFSHWCWLFAVPDTTASTAVRSLVSVIKESGTFRTLISNQAQSLIGRVMSTF